MRWRRYKYQKTTTTLDPRLLMSRMTEGEMSRMTEGEGGLGLCLLLYVVPTCMGDCFANVSASSYNRVSVSSQPMQASVIETPYSNVLPFTQDCLPGFRLLSNKSPRDVSLPFAILFHDGVGDRNLARVIFVGISM